MRFSVAAAATLLSVVSVQATQFNVSVGSNQTLTFSPTSISNVANGDTVFFQFQAKNHSVTQSSFAAPCAPLLNGSDSGFMFVPPGSATIPQYMLNITNASAPLWFFCAQTIGADHCGNGMVFAINPTPAKTFDMFQTAANATLTNSTTNGTSTTNSTSANGTTTGTSTAPASTGTSAALKLSGGAAGVMSIVALLLGVTL